MKIKSVHFKGHIHNFGRNSGLNIKKNVKQEMFITNNNKHS